MQSPALTSVSFQSDSYHCKCKFKLSSSRTHVINPIFDVLNSAIRLPFDHPQQSPSVGFKAHYEGRKASSASIYKWERRGRRRQNDYQGWLLHQFRNENIAHASWHQTGLLLDKSHWWEDPVYYRYIKQSSFFIFLGRAFCRNELQKLPTQIPIDSEVNKTHNQAKWTKKKGLSPSHKQKWNSAQSL